MGVTAPFSCSVKIVSRGFMKKYIHVARALKVQC